MAPAPPEGAEPASPRGLRTVALTRSVCRIARAGRRSSRQYAFSGSGVDVDMLSALDAGRMSSGDGPALVGEEEWTLPTPCTGWDVRYLAAHVIGGNRFAAFVLGGMPASAAIERVMAAPHLGQRRDDGVGDHPCGPDLGLCRGHGVPEADRPPLGAISDREFLEFRVFDITLHAWDLAPAPSMRADSSHRTWSMSSSTSLRAAHPEWVSESRPSEGRPRMRRLRRDFSISPVASRRSSPICARRRRPRVAPYLPLGVMLPSAPSYGTTTCNARSFHPAGDTGRVQQRFSDATIGDLACSDRSGLGLDPSPLRSAILVRKIVRVPEADRPAPDRPRHRRSTVPVRSLG